MLNLISPFHIACSARPAQRLDARMFFLHFSIRGTWNGATVDPSLYANYNIGAHPKTSLCSSLTFLPTSDSKLRRLSVRQPQGLPQANHSRIFRGGGPKAAGRRVVRLCNSPVSFQVCFPVRTRLTAGIRIFEAVSYFVWFVRG